MNRVNDFVSRYAKALGVFLFGTQTWLGVVVVSDAKSVTSVEWVGLYGVVVSTLVAYGIANKPED